MTPPTARGCRRAGPVLVRAGVGGVVSVADTPSPTVTGGVVTVITPPVGGVTVMTPPRRHPPTAVTTPLTLGGGGLAHHPKRHPRVSVPGAPSGCKAETGQWRPADAPAPAAGSRVRAGPFPRLPDRFPPRQRPIRRRLHATGPAPVSFVHDRGEVAVASVNWRKRGKRYLASWRVNCSGRTTTDSNDGLASEASG